MPKQQYKTDDLLTDDESAEVLSVPTTSIVYWMRQGRLPFYQLGHHCIRFKYGDLQEFLKNAKRRRVAKQIQATEEVPA